MREELRVLDEFPFTFYGETFTVSLANDRQLYVPLPLMCNALGLRVHGQVRRIERDRAIADSMVTLRLENYPYGEGQTRPREVSCLRLDRLPYWLGTIDASRIKDPKRQDEVVRFKREFADVAWAAFRSEILPEDLRAELDASLPAELAEYHSLMDAAAEMRRGLGDHEQRLDDVEERLMGLEARLEGTDFINPEQAKRYQVMVHYLANVLTKKGKGGHAIVHNEVKKVFKVPSYMLLPEARFPDAIRFLANWYERITPPGTPLPSVFTDPDQKRLL